MIENVKWMVVLGIITALIAFWQWDRHSAFQAGYNTRQTEEFKEYKASIEAINKAAEDKISAAVHERDHYKQRAILTQSSEPIYVTKTITKVVEKNINHCDSIIGFDELLNKSLERFSD